MAELLPCPFCGGEAVLEPYNARKGYEPKEKGGEE